LFKNQTASQEAAYQVFSESAAQGANPQKSMALSRITNA
jgi:hypothetical protein